jgi:hypothetical protein
MGVAAPASSSIDRHSLPTVHGKYDRRRWAMRVCFASLASHAPVCGAPPPATVYVYYRVLPTQSSPRMGGDHGIEISSADFYENR